MSNAAHLKRRRARQCRGRIRNGKHRCRATRAGCLRNHQ